MQLRRVLFSVAQAKQRSPNMRLGDVAPALPQLQNQASKRYLGRAAQR